MKKIYICIVLLSIICTAIRAMDATDREVEKISFDVGKARAEKRHGFQGCINKATCQAYGFYCQTYSQEGLCQNCELKQFPERYISCPFCRCPREKLHQEIISDICISCKDKVIDIILDQIGKEVFNNTDQGILKNAIFSVLSESRKMVRRNYLAAFKKDLSKKIPGFYLGCKRLENGNKLHIWSKSVIVTQAPVDKKELIWGKKAQNHIRAILNLNNIFGPETSDIIITDIPEDAVTYEEVIPSYSVSK